MGSFVHWITGVVVRFGYAGIFSLLMLGIVGLPIPDETLLLFAGYLIYKGALHLFPTLAAAWLGTMCGISLSYGLGRAFGLYALRHHGRYIHLSEKSVNRAHDWFQRMGRWSLFFGYFLPGIRHLTAYAAGASKLELPTFAIFAYTGGLIWSAGFIVAGYFLEERWARATVTIRHNSLLVSILICGILLGYYLAQRKQKR